MFCDIGWRSYVFGEASFGVPNYHILAGEAHRSFTKFTETHIFLPFNLAIPSPNIIPLINIP